MDSPPLPTLPPRPIDGHKGTFRTVGIIAGSCGSGGEPNDRAARMLGAPALVAMGANRSGCGLVKIASPEPILSAVLTLAPFATGYPIAVAEDQQIDPTDAMTVFDRLASESDALVIGPGLGTGAPIEQLIHHAIHSSNTDRLGGLVIDADGITALCQSGDLNALKNAQPPFPIVLTPHPGEAIRLANALSIEIDPAGSDEQRLDACSQIAQVLNAIVVLKGHHTVVADSSRQWVCQHGHPCLGVGGTGDVLAGMIGSLLAQGAGQSDPTHTIAPFDRVCIAVQAHAQSGQRWAELHDADGGMDPRDLGDQIPAVLSGYRSPH